MQKRSEIGAARRIIVKIGKVAAFGAFLEAFVGHRLENLKYMFALLALVIIRRHLRKLSPLYPAEAVFGQVIVPHRVGESPASAAFIYAARAALAF